MLYLLAAVIVIAALTLVYGVVAALRSAGRTRAAVVAARSGLTDRSGLVRARAAALHVAIGARTSPTGRVDSIQRGETGGRP